MPPGDLLNEAILAGQAFCPFSEALPNRFHPKCRPERLVSSGCRRIGLFEVIHFFRSAFMASGTVIISVKGLIGEGANPQSS